MASMVLVAACKGNVKVGTPQNGKTAAGATSEAKKVDPSQGVPVTSEDASRGSEAAYVTIVTFTDLACPRCSELAAAIEQLRERYTSDILRVVVKHMPSPEHANAKLAATAAHGVFATKGADAFFHFRDDLARHKNVDPDLIRKTAINAGLSPQEFEAGLESGKWTEKVERDTALGKRLGVTEAPVSFVNGISLVGVPSADVLKDTVEVELGKAKVLERSGVARKAIYDQAVAANFADPKTRLTSTNELDDPKLVWKVPVGPSPMRGRATALVTIIEFSEFDCQYCKQVQETLTKVRGDYGDKVRIVWKDQPQPSHARAFATANFARAARAQKGDAGFWDIHDKLFASQKLEDLDLELIAKNAGLDVKAAMSAAKNDTYRREIDADLDVADDVEAHGTPHFFVNGRRLVGPQPYEKFKTVLDEEVKKAEALLRGGVAASILYEWIVKDGRTGEPVQRTVPPNPNAPFRGTANAPVLVQEFCDFQSSECRRIEPTVEELLKAFPGKVKIAWRDLPLATHVDAPLAAEAAREAAAQKGNDAFFKMYGKLFGNQTNLKREDLEAYAKETGLDLGKFGRSLDLRSHRALVDADARVAESAGITNVPTFVVGNYIAMGPPTFAKLKKLVERVLGDRPSLPQAPPSDKPRPPGPGRDDPPPAQDKAKFSVVDLVVGTGRAARSGDTVTVHYRGRLLNGGEFDSSFGRGPFSFALGRGMVVKGWDMGLQGMRVGGRRRLTVPPELGYGNHGSGSKIPPNSTLVFEIELLNVSDR